GVARVEHHRLDPALAQGQLRDHHRRRLDDIPGENSRRLAGPLAAHHGDVEAAGVAVTAHMGGGGPGEEAAWRADAVDRLCRGLGPLHAQGHVGRTGSPAAGSSPKRMFIACTPWPPAPRTRLSTAPVTT